MGARRLPSTSQKAGNRWVHYITNFSMAYSESLMKRRGSKARGEPPSLEMWVMFFLDLPQIRPSWGIRIDRTWYPDRRLHTHPVSLILSPPPASVVLNP